MDADAHVNDAKVLMSGPNEFLQDELDPGAAFKRELPDGLTPDVTAHILTRTAKWSGTDPKELARKREDMQRKVRELWLGKLAGAREGASY